MDWDQLATVAQLVTGAATLAVAVFLATQLRIQRQDSERAHRDAEREILYAANAQRQDVLHRTLDPHFGLIYHKGVADFDQLDSEEQLQFRTYCQMSMVTQAVNFRSGHEGLDHGVDSRIIAQTRGSWKMYPGMATYYERYGRSHTYDPDLKLLLDLVFHETQGREVDGAWDFGVKAATS